MVFAEPRDINQEDAACLFYSKLFSEEPNSSYLGCRVKYECEDYKPSIPDDRITFANDYTVKQFMYQNPVASLGDWGISINGNMVNYANWVLRDYNLPYGFSPSLSVTFDICGNKRDYSYQVPGNDYVEARYPIDDSPERVSVFEKERYNVIKTLMQRHPPPAIQMSEFNISLNEIHCNEELELYIRNNSIPVCLKPQTYETLLERGFNLQ